VAGTDALSDALAGLGGDADGLVVVLEAAEQLPKVLVGPRRVEHADRAVHGVGDGHWGGICRHSKRLTRGSLG